MNKRKAYIKYAMQFLEENTNIWNNLGFHSFKSFIDRPKNFEIFLKKNEDFYEQNKNDLETISKTIYNAFAQKTIQPTDITLERIHSAFSIPLSFGEFEFKLENQTPDFLKYLEKPESINEVATHHDKIIDTIEMISHSEARMADYYKKIDSTISDYISLILRFQPLRQPDIDIFSKSVSEINYSLYEKIPWDLIKKRIALGKIIIRGLILNDKAICFYILYPLTDVARDLIETNRITRSGEFEPEHIASTYFDAKAVYVSWVFGHEWHDKALILRMLKQEIVVIKLNYPAITRIYTRPYTNEGEIVIRNSNFTYLSPIQYLQGFGN